MTGTKDFDFTAGLGVAGVAYGLQQKPLFIALIALAGAYLAQQILPGASTKMTQKQWDYIILGLGGGMVAGRSMGHLYMWGAGGAAAGYFVGQNSGS